MGESMNAIFSRFGNRVIEWDQQTLERALMQLRQERELANFLGLMQKSLAHAIYLIERCHDPELQGRHRRWLLAALAACAIEVVHPEAEPDNHISHVTESP
jgi:hypothetical protein